MFTSLKNHFLIAMPSLLDPHFFRSVTYLCEHTEQGAIGIIINQPLQNLRLGDVLEIMHIPTDYPEIDGRLILNGGPVQKNRCFTLHNKDRNWQSTLDISDTIAFTTSTDILQAIAQNQGPSQSLIALGFARWAAGQLEQEVANNTWLYGPANFDILFHMAVNRRWRAAAALMGVDIDRLSDEIGHA